MVAVRRAVPARSAGTSTAGDIDAAALEGLDGVVHLAGEGIGEKRWTDEQKRRDPREPHARAPRCSAERAGGLAAKPPVLVSGSAVGFYGDRGDEQLTEASGPGTGFLAEVVVAWEAATAPAAERGHPGGHTSAPASSSTATAARCPRMAQLAKLGLLRQARLRASSG